MLTAFATPFVILIVRYEKEKQNRTLINQLVAWLFHVMATPNNFIHIMFIIRYSFGTLPPFFCYLDLLARPGLVTFQLLLLDAICVIRYIFVFNLKNPTAVQDDFWTLFIVMFLFGLSFIPHVVFIMLPGNNPNYFYLCLGEIPKNHYNTKTKFNWILSIVLLFSILAHIFVGIKYRIYKYTEKKYLSPQLSSFKSVTLTNIDKDSMANFSTNAFGVIYLLITSIVPQKINTTDLQLFNNYPNYIWMYIFHFYLPPTFQIFSVISQALKGKQLRNYIKLEISEVFKLCL